MGGTGTEPYRDARSERPGVDDPVDARPNTDVLGARAVAALQPVGAAMPPVSGTAAFKAVATGVDLEIQLRGCMTEYSVFILDGPDCSDASLRGPHWDGERGEHIPGLPCTGAVSAIGRLYHTRSLARSERLWTVAGAAASRVTGHALALYDPATGEPVACGVIEAAGVTPPRTLPPLEMGPSSKTRAQIAGICPLLLGNITGRTDCPDPSAVAACAAEHCDLGQCLDVCSGYAACLDAQQAQGADTCFNRGDCQASTACSECQERTGACLVGFCAHVAFCAAVVTPDGPCSQLEFCCALTGENAAACLEGSRTLSVLGGDASCFSAFLDMDPLSSATLHCMFADERP